MLDNDGVLTRCQCIIALRLMTAPGALLETETACIDGRVYSAYKNLPPSCRALWLQVVRMYGDREYVVFEEQRYTFRVAHERALRTAAMFRDVYGVGKGGLTMMELWNGI